MTLRSDYEMRIEALGKALFLGQELTSSPRVVFFAVAYDVENGATHKVSIVYIDREGYAARGEFGHERQKAFFDLWEAAVELGPDEGWATFEMIVDTKGSFEINILYSEQTDQNNMENFERSYFSYVAEKHFPDAPLRPIGIGPG